MPPTFSDIITSEEQLREIIAPPNEMNINKVISIIDQHCKEFIAKSPFMLMSTIGPDGRLDVSPKGDPNGFVQVLDDKTLAIPDRIGNRRADTLTNLLQNPQVGLLFLIPGKSETLRISGTAQIVRDVWLRESMAVKGKIPDLAFVVRVEEAFMHCAKCIIRSKLWDQTRWPAVDDMASLACILIDHANLAISEDDLDAAIDEAYRTKVY